MNNLENLSVAELEKVLEERRKKEAKQKEAAKQSYEKDRDTTIEVLVQKALSLEKELEAFKAECHRTMDMHHEKLSQYGGIRSNSKGGFALKHSKGNMAVRRRRDTSPIWDERAQEGIALIRDFLNDVVKKRYADMFDVLMSFLEKNKAGDLEYSRVMMLLQHRNKWTDPRWVRGIELIEEGFSNVLKSFNYEFTTRDEQREHRINLNFSSI